MTGQVIAFPNSAAQPVAVKPLYSMEWVTEKGEKVSKHTTDDGAIIRQLSSCQRRGLVAIVRNQEGTSCGGCHAHTDMDGSRFVAHFLGCSWGD